MKITPVAIDFDISASDLVRSPGLHMSDIYNDLYKKLDPRRYKSKSDFTESLPLMGALGTAWENQLEYLLRKAGQDAHRPEEFRTKEGIAFSPDLLLANGHLRLGEIKLKWMSSKDMPRAATSVNAFPPGFQKHLTQMMSYCWNLETPYARIYSNHLIGNGRKPYKPELLIYDLEFSPREMRDEYQALINHARHQRML